VKYALLADCGVARLGRPVDPPDPLHPRPDAASSRLCHGPRPVSRRSTTPTSDWGSLNRGVRSLRVWALRQLGHPTRIDVTETARQRYWAVRGVRTYVLGYSPVVAMPSQGSSRSDARWSWRTCTVWWRAETFLLPPFFATLLVSFGASPVPVSPQLPIRIRDFTR
jgi:hypothetical protein